MRTHAPFLVLITVTLLIAGVPVPGEAKDGAHTADTLRDCTPRLKNESGTCASTPADYLSLLSTLDAAYTSPSPFARSHVRMQLSALEPLLPNDLKESINLEAALQEEDTKAHLSPDAGTKLLAWWRSQDPFPATESNERLTEHLNRVKYASNQFRSEADEALLDDRGKIYVRYGEPKDRVHFNVYVDERSFSEGQELWVYSTFHKDADYVFLHDPSEGYLLRNPSDIVKRRFGGPGIDGISNNPSRGTWRRTRGAKKADDILENLEEFYDALSLYSPEYGLIASDLRMPTQQLPSVAAVVNATILSAEAEESERARIREEIVPRNRTAVGDNLNVLSLGVRAIRRLNADNSTRVDLYWSAPPAQVRPVPSVEAELVRSGYTPSSDYVLAATIVEETETYERIGYHQDRSLLRTGGDAATRSMRPEVVSFPLQEETQRTSVQLDAYWADVNKDASRVRTRAKIATGTVRVEDLGPLSSDPGTIEMSDLLPRQIQDGVPIDESLAYPYPSIRPSTNLALDFEVYNLTFNAEDRTEYTIEYTVQRRVERDGVRAWFGRGEDETETVVESKATGTSRSTNELVDIQLSEWNVKDTQQVRILVTVTDDTSQQSVTRSVEFTLLPERSQ